MSATAATTSPHTPGLSSPPLPQRDHYATPHLLKGAAMLYSEVDFCTPVHLYTCTVHCCTTVSLCTVLSGRSKASHNANGLALNCPLYSTVKYKTLPLQFTVLLQPTLHHTTYSTFCSLPCFVHSTVLHGASLFNLPLQTMHKIYVTTHR